MFSESIDVQISDIPDIRSQFLGYWINQDIDSKIYYLYYSQSHHPVTAQLTQS